MGIIVTALLMGIATDEGRPLTDAEIKAAAAELGMVESDSLKLTDIQQQTTKPTSEATAEPTMEPTSEPTAEPTIEPTEEPTAEPTIEPTSEPTAEPTIEPTKEPTVEPTKEPIVEPTGEKVTLTIHSGESSVSVSKSLQQLGLVEDAGVYDQYLCDNGYSRRIAVGSFEIPVGAGKEEIAKIITRSK